MAQQAAQAAQRLFLGVAEYLTPVLTESLFAEKGVLTPDEFVAAGDQLVYKCPTWQWASGDPGKEKPYLPNDKQYLVTRNVPCRKRVSSLEGDYAEETEVEAAGDDADNAWLATHTTSGGGVQEGKEEDEFEDISSGPQIVPEEQSGAMFGGFSGMIKEEHFGEGCEGSGQRVGAVEGEDDEYMDMADFEEDVAGGDDATLPPPQSTFLSAEEPDDAIVRTRTYDISISYDKYYQTPRVWLFGFDEGRQPLSQEQMFEDIMQDYANRTVTMEAHPCLDNIVQASIHPCQHAAVMKRIVDQLSAGSGEVPRPDQYIFIFLKFIQSVIPTIDYDYTMEVSGR